MQLLRHALPAEQHHAEEGRFEEERGQHFVAEQRADDVAGLLAEHRPVGAELEAHHDARRPRPCRTRPRRSSARTRRDRARPSSRVRSQRHSRNASQLARPIGEGGKEDVERNRRIRTGSATTAAGPRNALHDAVGRRRPRIVRRARLERAIRTNLSLRLSRDFRRMPARARLLPFADAASRIAPCALLRSPLPCSSTRAVRAVASARSRSPWRRRWPIPTGSGRRWKRPGGVGRPGRAVHAQARRRDDPRHLAGRRRRRRAARASKASARAELDAAEAGVRRQPARAGLRAQWRRVRARPAQRRADRSSPAATTMPKRAAVEPRRRAGRGARGNDWYRWDAATASLQAAHAARPRTLRPRRRTPTICATASCA